MIAIQVVLNGEGGKVYYGLIKKMFEDKTKEKKMEVLWFFTGTICLITVLLPICYYPIIQRLMFLFK